MSQISKISINGTEYNLSEKLSSYYISYESPAFPEPGDSVETAISKLHADVELISNLGYLSEDYTAYTTSLGVEPQPDDSIELAISKLHRVILDNEYAIAASLIDINKKTFKYITLVYDNSDDLYYFIDENGNDITLDTAFGSDSYITNHTIIKYYDNDTYIERQYYPYDTNCNKYISIDDKNIYWLTFEIDSNDDVIVQLEQQPFESQFINSVAYNISQSDISNWNNKPDSFTETDPTVASYIKAITQSDISNWNSKLDSFTETDPTVASYIKAITQSNISNWNSKLDSFTETDPIFSASAASEITSTDISNWNSKTSNVGTITGITMNGASKGTSGVVDLGTVITDVSDKADASDAIGSLSLSMNSSTYVITLSGAKVDGTTFTVNNSIDLPLESVVVDGEYNSTTKKVVLTLKSGSTVEFSIADLINGLQSEITSTNKLSADLISDGTTNKTVTQTEKNSWNSKLDSFTETDPTVASYIKAITQSDISNWNNKLDSFTETDPTVASYIKAITQSDISNWNSKLDSFTETDPTVASYIKAITQSDISNWNSKTSNVGTITGITMNNTSKGTSGVVDLGTVLTEHQTLKTINNTSLVGSGNITINENVQSDWNASSGSAVILNKPTIPTVNDTTVTLTMNGSIVGTFTLNKNTNTTIDLGTVLTAHQSLKTINNNTITGTGNISIQGLPTVTSSDNGKVLMVVNGEWQLVSPVTLYSGSGAPNNAQGNNGDIYVQS